MVYTIKRKKGLASIGAFYFSFRVKQDYKDEGIKTVNFSFKDNRNTTVNSKKMSATKTNNL